MAYTREQLRKIFQNKFDREAWKAIVVDIFGANKVRRENELFTSSDEPETGYYMGSIDTPDAFRIGLFYYKINTGSVAHKKVGLRNLVKRFINQNWGEFDAAIVVFDDSQDWRLSFVCDIKEEVTAPKRFTYVFGETDNLYRTAIERFTILQSQKPTFENMRKAFSVDALSDDFFDEYRKLYATFVEYITGKRYVKERNKWVERKVNDPNYQYETTFGSDDRLVRDYIKKLFGRIVFLYFLQRKGWLDGNRHYMHDLFFNSTKKDDFLDGVLEPLFFEVLNTDKPYRTDASRELPGSENIPYLNGGLFARDETNALNCVFPEGLFNQFFEFLDSYNFTIDENDPEDAEIGIDPEMLGRIFENLLEDNKDKGAFYTPKEIVAYMCRESIIAYLLNGIPERSHELIRNFVDTLDSSQLNDEQRHFIKNKLSEVKICDPAIGSGAFPMGMVNLLSKLYTALGLVSDHANMKRHIMERSIYGVDIEKGAVDIARLRFWLAMVVDAEKPEPLPNLHFKIMQGNSLLESYQGFDLQAISNTSDTNNTVWNAEAAVMLRKDIDAFYNTSDHSIRDRRLYQICNSVRTQLINLGIKEEDLAGVDPSATDRFFLWHTWFAPIFKQGGFDIVIGNPPYLKERENKKVFEAINNSTFGKKYHRGKMDFWYYFMHKALEIAAPNGIISFITSRYWINSSGSKGLIAKIKESSSIISLLDIGNLKLFDNVVGHHMITQVRNKTIGEPCIYRKVIDDVANIPLGKFETERIIPTDKIISDDYEIVVEERNTFNYHCQLSDICEVSQGVVEASDKISTRMYSHNPLENYSIGDGIFVLSTTEIENLSLSDIERQSLVPYITDGCLSRYRIECPNHYLIYSNRELREKIADDAEYANLKRHLDRMSPYITSSNKPYGLHRPRQSYFFTSKKIIGPSMFKTPTFAIDDSAVYVGMSYNVIVPNDASDCEWITALLNSKFAEIWFNQNSKHRGIGNDVGVDKLRTFPLPAITDCEKEILSDLVQSILDAKTETPKSRIAIDKIVYHLYGLTYDEVLVIDPTTPITRKEYESRNVKKSIDS